MSIALIVALFIAGVAAGVVAALLGVGGGILMVPIMTLIFHVPTHNALGTSLVAGVLTSDAAALWKSKRRLMEVDLAWKLALASTFGATIGAMAALASKPEVIQAIFAVVLLYTAYQLVAIKREASPDAPDAKEAPPPGRLRQAAMGFIGLFAGASSGLLGIGGGIVIVPALHLVLRKPFKSATATSNLLIGVTALTGAFTYFWRGMLLPVPTLPIAAGAAVGAVIGCWLDRRLSSQLLRWGMAILLTYTALQMAWGLISARLGI